MPLFHADDLPALTAAIGRLEGEAGAPRTFDARIRGADSSWHVMETVGTDTVDDTAIHGSVVSLRDVTERRQVEDLGQHVRSGSRRTRGASTASAM